MIMQNFYKIYIKVIINMYTNSTKSGRNIPKAKYTKEVDNEIFLFCFPKFPPL